MSKSDIITVEEYKKIISNFILKGGEKINILGGEPLLHPNLKDFIKINQDNKLKTTIYTNGLLLNRFMANNNLSLKDVKIRVSVYNLYGKYKSLESIYNLRKNSVDFCFEICYMISSNTTLTELFQTANEVEKFYNCNVFFISSLRELDNSEKEFFKDTHLTMPVIDYKELVHYFLKEYSGNMEIHVSKRGVFESTTSLPENKCRFANCIPGGRIIQCPYDLINLKYQNDYEFGTRYCQHNNTCLMSKVIYKNR